MQRLREATREHNFDKVAKNYVRHLNIDILSLNNDSPFCFFELPFPDAKVAEKLCIGGACYYLFPEELSNTEVEAGNLTIAMLKTFILSNVVPNTRKRLPNSAALVLGKALLWLIYSPYDATHNLVPQDLKNRIRMEWNEIVSASRC